MGEPRVIVTTPDELREIIRAEVRAALASSPATSGTELLDISEVASVLGVTTTTVRAYVRNEGLPCVRMGKSTVRFRRSEVERWLLDRSENSGSHAAKARGKVVGIRGLGTQKH